MKFSYISIPFLMTFFITPFKFDFGTNSKTQDWYVVNDGVMGGRSQSSINYNDQSMVFSGTVSLENNGGFASLRSPYSNLQLENYTGIRMRVKSETGRKFQLLLEKKTPWYMPTYKHDFKTEKNEWAIIEMPIKDFFETRIGNPTGKKIQSKDIPAIQRLGIILYDKKAGDFKLEIDYIEIY